MVPVALLTVLKLLLLGLLYVFLFRTLRVVLSDVSSSTRPQRPAAPPRPAVASAEQPRSVRKIPREVVVHPPDGRPHVLPLRGDSLVLGRADDVDVPVTDAYISDQHAELKRTDGGWSIQDLGSTNGTFLNGAKVTQPTPLAAGDQVRIGKTRLELRR